MRLGEDGVENYPGTRTPSSTTQTSVSWSGITPFQSLHQRIARWYAVYSDVLFDTDYVH